MPLPVIPVPAMVEVSTTGAVPTEASGEDLFDVVDHRFGRPGAEDTALYLLYGVKDAILRRAVLGLVVRARNAVEHVRWLSRFKGFIDEGRQVRRKVVPKEHAVVVASVRRRVLFEVGADGVDELGEVDLVDPTLVEDSVPDARLGDGPERVVRHIRVSSFDGEQNRDFGRA